MTLRFSMPRDHRQEFSMRSRIIIRVVLYDCALVAPHGLSEARTIKNGSHQVSLLLRGYLGQFGQHYTY